MKKILYTLSVLFIFLFGSLYIDELRNDHSHKRSWLGFYFFGPRKDADMISYLRGHQKDFDAAVGLVYKEPNKDHRHNADMNRLGYIVSRSSCFERFMCDRTSVNVEFWPLGDYPHRWWRSRRVWDEKGYVYLSGGVNVNKKGYLPHFDLFGYVKVRADGLDNPPQEGERSRMDSRCWGKPIDSHWVIVLCPRVFGEY